MGAATSPSCRSSVALLVAAMGLGGSAMAQESPRLNPFGDPFVAVTAARPCAAPRGPAYTEAEIRQEAHYRAERGTSCWLAGRCSEPNAYRYDARIAEAATQALRDDAALADTALWLVAERRFITLLGCVADERQAARAAAIARAVPDVDAVLLQLALPGGAPSYPLARP